MGDRTPDTDVLDQDDPSAQPRGAEHGSGAESAEKDSGKASGEATAEAESAEAAAEAESAEKPTEEKSESPEAAEEPQTPEETQEPDQPEDPATAQEPAESNADAAAEPADEEAEPAAAEQSEEEPGAAGADPESPEAAAEPRTPVETQEPDQPEDSADATAQEPAEPNADADDEPADEGDAGGEAPVQEAGPLPDEAPDAEDDGKESDENAEAPAQVDDTAPDEDTDAAAEADDAAPDEDTDAAAEVGDPTPEPDTDALAKDSGSASDTTTDATTTDDPGEDAVAKEPEADAAVPGGSESTRTLALRSPEAASVERDRTLAISVDDLPDAEPEEAQPAPSPIDLLAQLTNTPPPPATPLRTTLRRIKIWSPLVALVVLVLLVVQFLRPLPEPTLALDTSASSFTIGGEAFSMPWPEEGQAAVTVVGSGSIGTFGEQKSVPTASVAKIMTAYVLLHERPLKRDEPGPDVTVDARTVEEGKSKDESRIEGLRVGQTFTLQDMLKMLMIPSGNNVARLLARWDTKSGDETAFVRKMNEAAKSLGMTNTTYTDPSGLDKGTVSTAVDQLKLAEAVMKFESFRAVVAMPNADIPDVGRIYNNNDLLVAGLSVRGLKTGSNTAAGGTLSWAAYRTVDGEDRLILGTMMDQHAPPPDPNGGTSLKLVLDNSEKVVKAVREALTSATAVKKGQVVGHVDDGLGGRTPVVATKDLKVVGVPGQKLKFTFRDGGEDLAAGTKAGTVVGKLAVDGGTGAQSVPVALQSELREPSLGTKLTRLG
ncbi:D-alanyl-D-alanine carboxypeptidase [Streptomyces sp. cf386]|uniref:D-alanyl-D-alanine carboxypeptidase family protein n=1 Tax=Streptomyces sp. cf386 TaxID=1761904 RepID=UPI000891BF3E|nr:serine hydrolase [Streptomyces sp. cf386]SDP40605.1 D-alanyl-D-alanine carboxypeptidase [Streptomyces sp. cf386]